MLNFIKKYLLLLKQDFWLYAWLALPGIIFYFIGLSRLDAVSWLTCTLGFALKFCYEFLTIAVIFGFLHVFGFKKRWVFAAVMFFYYITVCADITLLLYFKERFSVKYLSTLEGAQYRFLLDIRLILLLVSLYVFPFFVIRRHWHRSSRHASAKKIAVAAVLIFILAAIAPLSFFNNKDAFFASTLMETTVAGLVKDLTVKHQDHIILSNGGTLPPAVQAEAQKYNLLNGSTFVNKENFDRIILITTEALSNKFINSFNPAVPKDASLVLDGLVKDYPFASLKPVTLSTLYGLSVIISGHPNAELSFKNKFPLSFVRILKENGFKTAFIRGADEEYMDEHLLFGQAGFSEVYGAKYFARQPSYSSHVAWWGLTDRKLFDFAVEYLSKHRDEKVFINILTVDTHVPSGRADYPGQDYVDIEGKDLPRKISKIYKRTNMARAFYRFDHDLGLFLDNLAKAGLMDDRTLLIVTADHPFFANMDTSALFKNYRPVFDEVPFILISKKEITQSVSADNFKSQQDIAPTVLALAGFSAPKGMFGTSIFENADRTVFNIKGDYMIINNAKSTRLVPFNSSRAEDKAVMELVNTIVTD